MDSEKLSFADCNDIAKDIIIYRGENAFLSNANKTFGNNDDAVSNVYSEIKRQCPHDTKIEIMAQVLERLAGFPKWSRGALVEVLRNSHLAQTAKKISLNKGVAMNSVSLGFLPSTPTIQYLHFNLGLSEDIVSKLRAQEVDGRFLKDQYARGQLRSTFSSSPFNFPIGTAAKIERWVEESIRGGEEYDLAHVSTSGQTFIARGNGNIQAGGNVMKSSVSLEDIISRNDVWPTIGERLSDIQLELDTQLRRSSKPSSAGWFYVATSAQGGPKGRTKALFSEATQQMCLPEVIRAVSKVLPRIGSYFDQIQIIEIQNPTQGPTSNMNLTQNPFVESMEIQYQTKSMLASTLLSQKEDVPLKKLVARLMLALGENDAWLKFAKAKGATSGAAAEKRISDAQATGEPESIVIPMIAQAPGYLALTFLSELKSMVNARHVSEAVEKIEEHLVCVESSTQERGNKVAQVNSSIRQWIIKNELCDITSQTEIQARVDSLKDFEVTSLEDLKILDVGDFEKCGFRGVKAKKAYAAAQKN